MIMLPLSLAYLVQENQPLTHAKHNGKYDIKAVA